MAKGQKGFLINSESYWLKHIKHTLPEIDCVLPIIKELEIKLSNVGKFFKKINISVYSKKYTYYITFKVHVQSPAK